MGIKPYRNEKAFVILSASKGPIRVLNKALCVQAVRSFAGAQDDKVVFGKSPLVSSPRRVLFERTLRWNIACQNLIIPWLPVSGRRVLFERPCGDVKIIPHKKSRNSTI